MTARRFPLFGSMATAGLSTMAAGIAIMSLPWSYLSAGGSPAWAGVMAATLHLPVAVGLALGGRLSDRLGPRRILIFTDAACLALVAASLAAIAIFPAMPWLVAAIVAAANLVSSPGNVAQSSRVPEMARLARMPLERANGLQEIVVQTGQVLGPAAGVLLVEAGGLHAALLAAAVLLSIVLIVDAALFPKFVARLRIAKSGRAPTATTLLFRDAFLRTVIVVGVFLVAIFNSLDEVLAPNLALASGVGGNALAAFLFISGASALASAALFTYLGHRLHPMRVFIGGVWLAAGGFILLAFLPPSIAFLAAPLFIGGGVGPLWPIVVTWIQRTIPQSARGEAIGILSGCVLLAQPLAALVAGPAVGRFGTDALLFSITGLVIARAILTHTLIHPLVALSRRQAKSPTQEKPASRD